MEKLFWKVYRNKVIRNQILYEIKAQEVDFGKGEKWHSIGSRIDYNLIVSLEWMLEHKQYSMIIDKLNHQYIHITDDSIIQLIKTCTNEEVYKALFEKRRDDLERVNLILESIKQDSVFALSAFIKLYGGHEKVSNSFKDYLLLDYALSIPSLKTANYLLDNKLNEYTESNLVKNALSNSSFNYGEPLRIIILGYDLYEIKKIQKINQLRKIKIKETVNNMVKIKPNTTSSSKEIIRVESPIIKPTSRFAHFDNILPEFKENRVLSFIDKKLELPVTELIEKYKNDKATLPSIKKTKEISLKHAISLARNKYYKLDVKIGKDNDPSHITPLFSKLPSFNTNYDLEFLIYYLFCVKFQNTIPNCETIISNKKLQEFDSELTKILNYSNNKSLTIKELLESNVPQLPTYYLYYQFYKGDQGLKLIEEKKHTLFNRFQRGTTACLLNLSFYHFSINGLELLSKLPDSRGYFKCFESDIKYYNKSKQSQYRKSNQELLLFINYLESTQSSKEQLGALTKQFEIENQKMNQIKAEMDPQLVLQESNQYKELKELELKQCQLDLEKLGEKIEFINIFQKYKLTIPWDSMYHILISWYDCNTLLELINGSEFFKTQFSSTDTTSLFSKFCLISQLTGKLDLDKLDLFFKYRNSTLLSTPINYIKEFDGYDKHIEEGIKLINYLCTVKNIDIVFGLKTIGNPTPFYDFFNHIFYHYSSGPVSEKSKSLEDSIEVYSKLDIKSISGHKNLFYGSNLSDDNHFNLANYFFDNHLINAIFSSDTLSIIKILSYLNNKEEIEIKIPDGLTPIQIIQHLFKNQLLDLFGLNLTKLILDKLSNNQETYSEQVILELIQMILKLSNKVEILVEFIVKISLERECYRILSYLYYNGFYNPYGSIDLIDNSSGGIGILKNQELLLKSISEYNLSLTKPKTDKINEFLKNLSPYQDLLSLFLLGCIKCDEYILECNKNPTPRFGYGFNKDLTLNLSTLYSNLESFTKLCEILIEKFNIPFKEVLSFSILYHRVDIIDYLFDAFEVTSTEYPLFLPVFIY